MRGMKRVAGILGGMTVALFAGAPAVFAQGCALCYTNAAATGAQGTATLRHAILVLVIPPLTIFGGIIGMLYQRRNSCGDATAIPEGPMEHFEMSPGPRSSGKSGPDL